MARFKSKKFNDFKKRAILDAASSIFSEKGMNNASMRAIAAEADLTTGALYSMFNGKEHIYAELLGESLERLYDHVAEKTEAEEDPRDGVIAAVEAFYDYFSDKPSEVELGLYSFAGMKSGSVGREYDSELNQSLIRTLDIIASAIARASPTMSASDVRGERDAIFSSLIGTLIFHHTGRARSIGTSAREILNLHVKALENRL